MVVPPEEHAPANWREDMVSALTKGTCVACDGLQGRAARCRSAEAVYECARDGKPVRVRRVTSDGRQRTTDERGGETRWS